jgi:hypothetical protein
VDRRREAGARRHRGTGGGVLAPAPRHQAEIKM